MVGHYKYKIEECSVDPSSRNSLIKYREKRIEWLTWLEKDEEHSFFQTLSNMLWEDVAFRTLVEAANIEKDSALENPLLAHTLIHGHVALQLLAIRRLMDPKNGTMSLPRLLQDLKNNHRLFTREIYICYDGLPYDFEEAERYVIEKQTKPSNFGKAFFADKDGPYAYLPSKIAHERFDKICGVHSKNRTRQDRIPVGILEKLDRLLNSSKAEKLIDWANTYLTHAPIPSKFQRVQNQPNLPPLDDFTETMTILFRVYVAMSEIFLGMSEARQLVPASQFHQFALLSSPIASANKIPQLRGKWENLEIDRNKILDGYEVELGIDGL